MKNLVFVIILLVLFGCHSKENSAINTISLNCPSYYSKIENVYCADQVFVEASDSMHQYWYRLITFSEEEGFTIIVEKLRQGVAEGLGKIEVVEQRNITHTKGIEDTNGISLHYNVDEWISSKEVVLEFNAQNDEMKLYKIVNLETLIVRDSILK